jgi:hypothetical protein
MMNSRQDNPLQSSSLSTYIGYITGPRAEQPVGVRVVEPPLGTRQHQRGSLYAVIELIGDHPDRAAIVDRLLSEVQRVYYSAKGSQSQVMLEAVQQTQQLLREINAHTPHYPLQLGIAGAALIGGKLLIASSGPAFALMSVSGQVHMFPSEPKMSGGVGNVPVEIYRQDVQADDILFLAGGTWLRRVPTRTLAGIVAFTTVENCTDAADELYDQAGQMQVPGLLIVLGAGSNHEPPRSSGYGNYGGGGYPSAPGGGTGGGTPPRSQAPRRPRFGGLPTALNTAPPARMPPSTPLPMIPPSSPVQPSSSGAPPGFTSSVQPRASGLEDARLAWEQPPTELLPSKARTVVEPPDATVDEPIHETPLRHTSSADTDDHETPNEIAADETIFLASTPGLAPDVASSSIRGNDGIEPSGDESPAAAQTSYEYPVAPLEEESFGGDLPVEPGDEFDPIFPPSPHERVEQSERRPSWLAQWQAQTNARVEQARHWLGGVLPERRRGEANTAWEELSDDAAEVPQKPVRSRFNELATSVGGVDNAPVRQSLRRESAAAQPSFDSHAEPEETDPIAAPVLPVMEMSPFAPPAPTRGARARLFLLIALVIVVLVPAVVAAVNIGQGNSRRAEAEQLTARAEIVLLGAQSALDQGDKVAARERLIEAQDYLGQAIKLDGTNDNRAQLIATIQSELQEVLQITPLYGLTEPLITFPADARPEHVMVMNEDIFVIDGGRQALLQYRLDPATGTVPDQMGQVLLRQGDQVDGVTVGTLADMAWLPLIPGFEDRPSLLITDRNNNVFRYDQRVEGASLMQLADRATWGSIGQIQTFNGRIYVADEAKGSILRYDPGHFDAPGESWFAPEVPVDLTGLISMEIDGDIWLLFSNGAILRYRDRQQLPFSPENSIGLAEEPTDMYVTRQDSAYIYLVDAGQDRILVYDKEGAYVEQLVAPEDDLLRGLSGIYIDEVGGVMYILTQTGLFAHPVLP